MANCTATIVILQKRGKQAWPRELLPLWQSIFADYPLIIILTYVLWRRAQRIIFSGSAAVGAECMPNKYSSWTPTTTTLFSFVVV